MIIRPFLQTIFLLSALVSSGCATSPEPTLGPTISSDEVAAPIKTAGTIPQVTGVIVESTDPFDVLETLIEARKAYADGEFQRAANAFQTVLLNDPKLFEARLGLAESLYALGHISFSKEILSAASPAEISHTDLDRSDRLQLLLASHLSPTEETAASLQTSIQKYPRDLRLYIRLAQLLDREGKWAEAQSVYSRALSMAPDHASLRNNFGMSLLAQGRWKLAALQFEAALKSDPEKRLYENNMRLVSLLNGEEARALEGMIRSRQAALFTDAGRLTERAGKTDRARLFYEAAIKLDPSHNVGAIEGLRRVSARET